MRRIHAARWCYRRLWMPVRASRIVDPRDLFNSGSPTRRMRMIDVDPFLMQMDRPMKVNWPRIRWNAGLRRITDFTPQDGSCAAWGHRGAQKSTGWAECVLFFKSSGHLPYAFDHPNRQSDLDEWSRTYLESLIILTPSHQAWTMVSPAIMAPVPNDNHNKAPAFIASMTIMSAIALILVSLRVYVRLAIVRPFGPSEFTIVLAMVCITALLFNFPFVCSSVHAKDDKIDVLSPLSLLERLASIARLRQTHGLFISGSATRDTKIELRFDNARSGRHRPLEDIDQPPTSPSASERSKPSAKAFALRYLCLCCFLHFVWPRQQSRRLSSDREGLEPWAHREMSASK